MATIVTRSGKGSALTHTEMDANFNNLNTAAGKVTHTVFTSSGTWSKPSGCTRVKVTVVGGGGCSASTSLNYSGGGAGGCAIEIIDNPSSSVTVTVGAGLTTHSFAAATAGTSSFGTYCSATGGGRYNSGGTWKVGLGGSGSGGDINMTGGQGTNYYNDSRAVMPDTPAFINGYGTGGEGGGDGTDGIVIVEEYY